jgi:ATP-dependent Clp protease ATP-binding subunit ClpA
MSSPAFYDRLTDRSRRVLELADEEAGRLNHEYVGTEHLLLGLVREGSGVAANVLLNLDIDLRTIRREVESLLQPGTRPVHAGRRPRSPGVTRVIEYAMDERINLGHNYLGTEHLLLGLLHEEGVAAQVLMNIGLRLEGIREEVLNLLGHSLAPGAASTGPRRSSRDFPEMFQRDMQELDAQIERLNERKEAAVAEMDFERAAHLLHEADQLKKRKEAALGPWLAQYPLDPSWLAWNCGAVVKLAHAIKNGKHRLRWQDLPILADALEEAGCTDGEILRHCRQAEEHFLHCWVLDLILTRASAGSW